MSNGDLIFHLNLDGITDDDKVIDSQGSGLEGSIAGNPQVVPEQMFGSCLAFDGSGDSVTIPDSEELRLTTYTAMLWLHRTQAPSNWEGIMGKPGRNFNIWLHQNGLIHHCFHTPTSTNVCVLDTPEGSITWNKWHHVAITNDGTTAKTYIDGQIAAQGPTGGELIVDNTPLIIARNLDDKQSHFFNGRLANARLYNRALSVTEIQRDIQADQAALSAFIQTNPLDFTLSNDEDESVLYISDDPQGQTLILEIINASRRQIVPHAIAETADANTAHFELRFRPGTLPKSLLDQITLLTPDWAMAHQLQPGGEVSFYFTSQKGFQLDPDKRLKLTLQKMRADAHGGARGTRVEMRYQNVSFNTGTVAVGSSRIHYLNIVNHKGKKHIPLHVGFVGSNTVMSDGQTPSSLKLRIANVSTDTTLSLNPVGTTEPTTLLLSFDLQASGTTKEWALMEAGNASGVVLTAQGTRGITSKWRITRNDQAERAEWTIQPEEATTIPPEGALVINLQTIIALRSVGQANLYLRYKNIPGYWDGQYVLVAEKSPLLFASDHIGIGTTTPTDLLQLSHFRQSGEYYLKIAVEGTNGGVSKTGIKLKHWSDDYGFTIKSNDNSNPAGLNILRHQNQADGISSLFINRWNGFVGIGTDSPGAKLEINGEIKSKKYQFLADSKWQGQHIQSPGTHVIDFIKRNDPYDIFDDTNNRFVAPTAGYYFFATNLTFGGGNGTGDGVIVGIYKNGDVNDLNSTIIVITPGKLVSPTAQSITSLMNLAQGDKVDVRLEGVDDSRFYVNYNSFMGYLINK